MGTVAYFEGTDPIILTKLAIKGVNTLPVGNGMDNHGKNANHLTKEDNISCVIGYLHKVLPVMGVEITAKDILYTCNAYRIPVLLIAPESDKITALKLVDDSFADVEIVTPEELYDRVMEIAG